MKQIGIVLGMYAGALMLLVVFFTLFGLLLTSCNTAAPANEKMSQCSQSCKRSNMEVYEDTDTTCSCYAKPQREPHVGN